MRGICGNCDGNGGNDWYVYPYSEQRRGNTAQVGDSHIVPWAGDDT